MRTRFAIVRGVPNTDPNRAVAQVDAYMPSNYEVIGQGVDDLGVYVLIAGTDDAGWTLAEYVIPRLASGLYSCRELVEVEVGVGIGTPSSI